MTRWEYLRSEDMDIEAMNAKGHAGWELCGVVQTVRAMSYPRPTLYWKRSVEVVRAARSALPDQEPADEASREPSPTTCRGDDSSLRSDAIERLREARDLLMERIYGNPARSPAHNARLVVEDAIRLLEERA